MDRRTLYWRHREHALLPCSFSRNDLVFSQEVLLPVHLVLENMALQLTVFSPTPDAPPVLKPKRINGLPTRSAVFCCHKTNVGSTLDKVKVGATYLSEDPPPLLPPPGKHHKRSRGRCQLPRVSR